MTQKNTWLLQVLLLSSVGVCVHGFLGGVLLSPSWGMSSTFSSASTSSSHLQMSDLPYGMTPELQQLAEGFALVPDHQTKYKQLLFMADTTAEVQSLPASSRTEENKVPGCMSTVYVDAKAEYDEDIKDYVIHFMGDSDSSLTKGLVALLMSCLSGHTAEEIRQVDPGFIKLTGLDQSLTPGRNNGFLNMLTKIKQCATERDEQARAQATPQQVEEKKAEVRSVQGPKHKAILEKLQKLEKVSKLELYDTTAENMDSPAAAKGESHFELYVVAEDFEGLHIIKRHQMIFEMIGTKLMDQIYRLDIMPLTEEEERLGLPPGDFEDEEAD